ncbi:MAG: BMC domain-containing protein [Planctomycetes bacterium]|nr:BMC domain-containing protein [Planctomycetota bacterium]
MSASTGREPPTIDLRTFVYLDVLQPQLASFLATVSQGYLPRERQASLVVEIAPGIAINRVTDIALKATGVVPGMQIVERAFGILELHDDDQGRVRAAGQAILDYLRVTEHDRAKPRVVSNEIITGVSGYQTMLVNRMRHGDMILDVETLWILETQPAAYALFAANEAEKTANVKLLEVNGVGAFGRLFMGGDETSIHEAARAATAAIEGMSGRTAFDRRTH